MKFIKYEDVNQLEKLFFENLTDVTGMKDLDDIDSFNKSLGAEINKYTNYPNSNDIENWQILTPTRFLGVGSYYFNEKFIINIGKILLIVGINILGAKTSLNLYKILFLVTR